MEFIWPKMLTLLLVIPPAVAAYLRIERRRVRALAQYGDLGFAQKEGKAAPALRRHIPPLFFLASLMIVIVSLARPQAVLDVPRLRGTILLAFDVSGSMAADDLEPTRMEAAKAAARAFVARQPDSVLIGVVAFSDSGFAVQMPTNDGELIAAAIDRLAPERGTSLGNGILASLQVLLEQTAETEPRYYTNLTPAPTPTPTSMPQGVYAPAAIILLTDGENTASPNPLAVARLAAEQGVRIYTVGIGSAAGANLTIEGFIVHTRLDEAMLQQISEITGGSYSNAESEQELRQVYEELRPQLVTRSEHTEVTAALAGAGILMMLVGTALSIVWFSRPL